MTLSFTLSMPGVQSWNGRWTGEANLYVRVESIRNREKAEALIGYHTYGFSDGWRAAVTVEAVTPSQARSLRKKTAGFAGYDWMVKSLVEHGKIQTD